MVIKRSNKKGQEMSVATLILIVIGIVVLVMLILGFSIGWSNLLGKVGILGGNSDLSTVVQACNLVATSGSTFDYCSSFKQIKVSGQTEYLNCEDSRIQSSLDKTLVCDVDEAKTFCQNLKGDAVGKTVVNGKPCSEITSSTSP